MAGITNSNRGGANMNYVEVAVPFFVLAMLVELIYGWIVRRQTYRLNDTVNSLQLGTLSQLNKVLRLTLSATALGAFAVWLGVPQWSMSSAWQWVVAFVFYDFCYYWKHRYGHEWRIMWASHVAHHQSEEFNLSTALRQTGTDYIGFVFYLPVYLIGVPAPVVITVGSLNLIYQFWVHTEHIRRLGPLEWILVTPSNHRVHHARNETYLDKNYGGVFIVWDRLFGTFKDERADEPCVYGITTGLKSWNPIWANFHFWIDTAKLAWRTRNWFDKLKIWFKPPAWIPADLPQPEKKDWHYSKFDPPTTAFVKGYVFVQYWLLLGASLWLESAYKDLPITFTLLLFTWICFAFFVQGVWLEAKASALRLEWLRIGVALIIAGLCHFVWSSIPATVVQVLISYAVLSAMAVAIDSLWFAEKQKPVTL